MAQALQVKTGQPAVTVNDIADGVEAGLIKVGIGIGRAKLLLGLPQLSDTGPMSHAETDSLNSGRPVAAR